jgi:hypothetical protein
MVEEVDTWRDEELVEYLLETPKGSYLLRLLGLDRMLLKSILKE